MTLRLFISQHRAFLVRIVVGKNTVTMVPLLRVPYRLAKWMQRNPTK